MTCRHTDPINTKGCSSYRTPEQQADALKVQLDGLKTKYKLTDTPDASNFEIEDVEEVNGHVILKVKYPNCAKCSYEGTKVMVYLDTAMKDVLKWRTIDPHFRENASDHKTAHKTQAPGPDARFPASAKGWQDAIAYAQRIGMVYR